MDRLLAADRRGDAITTTSVTRAAVFRDPTSTSSVSQFAVIQSAAGSFGVELSPIDLREASEIERGVTAFARTPNGGLIVTGLERALIAA